MKKVKIPARLFIKNRSKLVSQMIPGTSAVLFSADMQPRNGDQYFPYRQSSDFLYLTGIHQERSILMLNPWHPDAEYREVLFILKPDEEMLLWNGHKLTVEEAFDISGISNVRWIEDCGRVMDEILRKAGGVYLNIPEIPKFNPEADTSDQRHAGNFIKSYPLHTVYRLSPLIQKIRMIKEPEEIELIREACRITLKAFEKVKQELKPGMYEYELEAILTSEFIRNGASGHAYDPIIAGGANACILHYTTNDQLCRDGDLLLLDFGAEYGAYAADCSRTIPVNGTFTSRQNEVYSALLEVFLETKKLMKPGILMADFHSKVGEMMQEIHIRLGLYSRSDAEKSVLWTKYYMHGTSHSIGLDVHDPFDRQIPFSPGMVLSCEPAIYIREENLGMRIENDILITEDGNEDLMGGERSI